MSGDSSNKKQWGPITAVVLGFLAYKLPELLVGGIIPFIMPLLPFSHNVRSFVLYGIFESLAIGAVLVLLKLYGARLSDIGLGKFRPDFVIKAALGFCSYFVLTALIVGVASQLLHIPDQPQQLGFTQPSGVGMVLAFIALVVVVPLAEELLFRGFLFKGVRSGFSFITTSLVVSALFAAAHGQLNVGLDVFALSLVLCYLRENSGSLWPGILLHSFKNAIAFFMLFIYNG